MFQCLESQIQFKRMLIYFCFVCQVFQRIKNIVRKFCNPLKDQVFDIEGHCFEHLKGFKFGDCFDGGTRLMY